MSRIHGEKRKYSTRRHKAIDGKVYRVKTRADGSLRLKLVDTQVKPTRLTTSELLASLIKDTNEAK